LSGISTTITFFMAVVVMMNFLLLGIIFLEPREIQNLIEIILIHIPTDS
jgi:hypothetical protein